MEIGRKAFSDDAMYCNQKSQAVHAVAKSCCKGDQPFQWEMPNFSASCTPNL